MNYHVPVLLDKVLEYLLSKLDGVYVDCTMGEAGHSLPILEKLHQNGILISLDQDAEMIEKSLNIDNSTKHWIRKNHNFRFLEDVLSELNISTVDGIFADLGLSMFHYKASQKGFSFQKNDLLDMTFSFKEVKAYDVVNFYSVQEIQDILWKYGEEHFAKRIAQFIEFYRENVKLIETTKELADIVSKAIFSSGVLSNKKIHPATKTFQALRIFLNKELESLEILLSTSLGVLNSGGSMVLLTYHSLEDRIVKRFIEEHKEKFKKYSKKPIIPLEGEIAVNKAARSAKLRFFTLK